MSVVIRKHANSAEMLRIQEDFRRRQLGLPTCDEMLTEDDLDLFENELPLVNSVVGIDGIKVDPDGRSSLEFGLLPPI